MAPCCGKTRKDTDSEWEECEGEGPYQCSVPQAEKCVLFRKKGNDGVFGTPWSYGKDRHGKIVLCAECALSVTMAHLTPLREAATSKQGEC